MTDSLTASLRRSMAALHVAHEEGFRLMEDGCELGPRHQATVYSAMVICDVDGMQQLSLWLAEELIKVEPDHTDQGSAPKETLQALGSDVAEGSGLGA